MPREHHVRRIAAFLGAGLIGFGVLAALTLCAGPDPPRAQHADSRRDGLRGKFARPSFVPHPPHNLPTPAKLALGQRLFNDPALSANGTIACATCHDARLAFTDGEVTGAGVTGRRLARHTPALWNLAWSPLLLWDGRAASLEEQVRVPIEHADEMGESMERVAARLASDASYARAFAEAFPEDPAVTAANLAKAIAAWERTLVSPPTRFDRWLAGEALALSRSEQRGLELFTGRGQCSDCHSGFAFTDHGFYDIGRPGNDAGRGPVLGLDAATHAFKTPTLRELAWTAPYMHDGALATLEDVVRHYERGGVARPTRARDLPRALRLSDAERADLVAFLESLSSETPPQPSTETWVGIRAPARAAAPAPVGTTISQRDKRFQPDRVRVGRGGALTILNDDTRTHNVRIYQPGRDYNSGAQEPGQSVTVPFPEAGNFEAFCGIHPTMRLRIEVD